MKIKNLTKQCIMQVATSIVYIIGKKVDIASTRENNIMDINDETLKDIEILKSNGIKLEVLAE